MGTYEQTIPKPEGERYLTVPNRKGSKNHIKVDNGIEEIHKHYKKTTIKEIQQSYKVFKTIITEMNIAIRDKILNDAETVHLPNGLGYLRIKKSKHDFSDKKQRLRVDWDKSRKLKKTVYHLNDHTNGHKYRWAWHKKYHLSINAKIKPYSFTPSRENKRTLAKILKTNKDRDYWT